MHLVIGLRHKQYNGKVSFWCIEDCPWFLVPSQVRKALIRYMSSQANRPQATWYAKTGFRIFYGSILWYLPSMDPGDGGGFNILMPCTFRNLSPLGFWQLFQTWEQLHISDSDVCEILSCYDPVPLRWRTRHGKHTENMQFLVSPVPLPDKNKDDTACSSMM